MIYGWTMQFEGRGLEHPIDGIPNQKCTGYRNQSPCRQVRAEPDADRNADHTAEHVWARACPDILP